MKARAKEFTLLLVIFGVGFVFVREGMDFWNSQINASSVGEPFGNEVRCPVCHGSASSVLKNGRFAGWHCAGCNRDFTE